MYRVLPPLTADFSQFASFTSISENHICGHPAPQSTGCIYEGWNFNFGNTPLDWIQELLE